MIIFDTETTGFAKGDAVPLKQQPQIIEFAGIKLDPETLEEVERLEFLANPGIKLPSKIVEITGITDDLLKDELPFSASYGKLASFFLGETTLVAHNLDFDRKMMFFELARLGRQLQFPWPPRHICTVEKSYSLHGYRLSLAKLYKEATGEEFEGAHRAMADTEALVACVKWMREKGLL